MKYVNGAFRVDRSQAKWNTNGSSGSKFEVHGVAMSNVWPTMIINSMHKGDKELFKYVRDMCSIYIYITYLVFIDCAGIC